MSKNPDLLAIAILAALALAVAGCAARQAATPAAPTPAKAAAQASPDESTVQPAPPLPVGTKAPALTTKALDGTPISLKGLRGKVVMLDFWATWCPPCIMATPTMEKMQRQFGPQGLHIVGISLDEADSRADIPKYVKRLRVTYPLAYDPDANYQAAHDYDLFRDPDTLKPNDQPTPPAVFLIDRKGIIRWCDVGYYDAEGDDLSGMIKRLLAEKT